MYSHRSQTGTRFGCDRRILIVADQQTEWADLRTTLENEGCDVKVASGSSEALRLVTRDERPDLIVLEIEAPRSEGFRLAHTICALTTIPIIGVSSLTDEETVVEAIATFAEDFMVKPIYSVELMMRIRRVLLSTRQRPVDHPGVEAPPIEHSGRLSLSFA